MNKRTILSITCDTDGNFGFVLGNANFKDLKDGLSNIQQAFNDYNGKETKSFNGMLAVLIDTCRSINKGGLATVCRANTAKQEEEARRILEEQKRKIVRYTNELEAIRRKEKSTPSDKVYQLTGLEHRLGKVLNRLDGDSSLYGTARSLMSSIQQDKEIMTNNQN